MPPSGCPIIEACAQHCWLKKGCRRCQEVEERAKPALPGLAMAEQGSTVQEETAVKEVAGVAKSAFGFPVPPAKFYARARVSKVEKSHQQNSNYPCTCIPLRPVIGKKAVQGGEVS